MGMLIEEHKAHEVPSSRTFAAVWRTMIRIVERLENRTVDFTLYSAHYYLMDELSTAYPDDELDIQKGVELMRIAIQQALMHLLEDGDVGAILEIWAYVRNSYW
ncbi:hypothetical protein EJ08DRAFT_649850 [Tothia fuscella]|uniref:Uncharacterized protein n=1 Tax=Tothia fuscella TaxID=1048955 RepID=A0A9P4NRG3_9PEZI|nr:hypothetical protein EJ08DRAFT_649850 [Tothia fuscella]